MDILGIETSCDDTCIALLSNNKLLYNFCRAQDHNKFGGIFPEYASRNHMSLLAELSKILLSENKSPDLIAVTNSPGLLGSLIVGVNFAKSLAMATETKLIGINHIEAHILSARYDCEIDFPYGVLLVSGGHTIIAIADSLGVYDQLGGALDDAAGECFDKVAREIGLPQPGGPGIEKLAKNGSECVNLPIPLHGDRSCNFSFSGLKTSAIRAFRNGARAEDIAASLQGTIAYTLSERLKNAHLKRPDIKTWAIVGGVAANKHIYEVLNLVVEDFGGRLVAPSIPLCTDNAAMIAYCGMLYSQKGCYSDLDLKASPAKGIRASFKL